MKKRYNVYLDEDNVEALRYLNPDFNLSKFFDECITEFLLDGEEIINPIREKAKKIAKQKIKERSQQQKLIEESKTYEKQALDMKRRDDKIFSDKASLIFEIPKLYIQFLPEYGDNSSEFWENKAKVFSDLCGYPVSAEKVINYIREVAYVH